MAKKFYITEDDFVKAKEKQARKAKRKQTAIKAANWTISNLGTILTVAAMLAPAVTVVARTAGRNINLHKEENLKKLYCYDTSLGHYWRLKRPLGNSDWTKIDKRRRNGESLATILEDLKVLK